MTNTEIWDRHADIDPAFTKAITGKAYKGTSPSPQHVIWCLTDLFGPVGQGFGWTVVAEGFQPLGDELLHWCRIEFWHTDRRNVFDAYGQTKAIMRTKNGFMSDEDAPKKSLTDAIVKAASQIGIAANIFLGRWDDQKYVAQVAQDFHPEPKPEDVFSGRELADKMLAAVKGANAPLLGAIEADPKFQADLEELDARDQPKANEVRAAVEARRKELAQKDAA